MQQLRASCIPGSISLLAILGSCIACGVLSARSTGFGLNMAYAEKTSFVCEDNTLRVTALPNHRFRLNENLLLNASELVRVLHDKLRLRTEKAVYVKADREVFYEDFVRMIATLYRQDTQLVIITDRLEQVEREGGCILVPGLAAKNSRMPDSLIPDGLK